ncbi:hypothetical protein SU69_07505 [Thermosipho melanesiensis]|uniref:Uncharacterized protein n=2 Tax=Thermosipho melanesiensis TaxID=46541 RepID=A6LN22_THEM4|nr:hypothetical protein [Thermosipho melanesiensis]ABR31323.1 hypothetical protein Tmel_1476 [Thermosipho melanesiensis BI429]APT74921.1 hypothetical protein BW47_07860 [Thermosipho melanesiensis]OOC36347.1 hypothetical protein SU68_07575 [Thermosipho melanesiensis]OOC37165.1 hypothetical protein SU69_07505 [Thermosipho melanesiensis]OOC37917.1 hypothetical protein SU70_07515 [Thermosipho melanesiensis]
MILIEIDLHSIEKITVSDNNSVFFVALNNYLKLADFPENFNDYGNKLNFHLGIITRDDDSYIEYCKKTGEGFYNFLKYLKSKYYKISASNTLNNIYSPIVVGAFEEIKNCIKEKFDPKYVFGKYEILELGEFEKYVHAESNLIIPLFSRSEELNSSAGSLNMDI